jgi:decaprenyl-phosphate phosphoribosyltransferase
MSDVAYSRAGCVASTGAWASALVRAARPRQWVKNGLVVAAPAAAGVLTNSSALWEVALTFVAFCCIASGTYFLNDARDLERDRLHPTKRFRPVAAGLVSLSTSISCGMGLMIAGLATALVVNWKVAAVAAAYIALTTAYTLRLKNVPVIELAAVAGCFVVRALAGAAAVDVPLSRWFLIVVSFQALFVVAAKRHSEHVALDGAAATRPTLAAYPLSFLRYVWMLASGVAVVAYCLWAFAQDAGASVPIHSITIAPFVLFILQYVLLVERGEGGAPEELVFRDRTLLSLGAIWALLFAVGIAV